MNRTLLFTFYLILYLASQGQEKIILGTIFDESTNKRVAGVSISPSFNDDTIFSNSSGRVKILMPKSYRDTLVFAHPEYYPYIKRVKWGNNLKMNFIPLIPLSFDIDTICFIAYDENYLFTGTVVDDLRDEPILNAVLSLENDIKVAYTKKTGRFSVVIPKSQERIIFSHHDFLSDTILIKNKNIRSMDVRLNRVNFSRMDTIWRSFNNVITWSINEIFLGSIGLSYQRFISFRHAVGVHTSTYLNGSLPEMFIPESKFKGFKGSIFYRLYENRKMSKSNFFEFKVITGYFDFHQLYYAPTSDERRGEHYTETFWSYGFGGGLGWSLLPRSKHAILTLYTGFQIFPTHVPRTKSRGNQVLYVKDLPWYLYGPGSGLEIKISLGGIF